MAHGIQRKPGASTLVARHEAPPGSVSPGKRTLTEQLGETAHEARPIQRKALGDPELSYGEVTGKAIGHVVESNLDAIGDPGRENQILRNQELDRATGRNRDGGRVEPSFTIKRF